MPIRQFFGYDCGTMRRPALKAIAILVTVLLGGVARGRAAQVQPGALAPQVITGLGGGTVALDGPWKFHTGDDPAWASPGFDDSRWEQIDISQPWGDQGHWSYSGFAWYRRRIDFESPASDATEIGLYLPAAIIGQYEVFWNGRLVGRTGRMPASPTERTSQPAAYQLHEPGNGVLAIRVWSTPPDSSMSGDDPGFSAAPRVGNSEAVELLKSVELSRNVRSRFLTLIETLTYGQLFLLSLLTWWRNRRQRLLFWLSLYFLSAFFLTFFDPALPPFPIFHHIALYINSTFHTFEDISLWYLLLYLLNLDGVGSLRRWTRALAWIALASALCDEILFHIRWTDALVPVFERLDAVFTAGFSLAGLYPLVLILLGFRRSHDPARRFVVIAAFLSEMYFVIQHSSRQGQRFTHWTLGGTMLQPLFHVMGVEVHAQDLLSLLLLISIVYAVYHFIVEQAQRQRMLQQEFKSAQELQRLLIPEALPALPGYAVTSAYRPAAEVGGDFFQLIPFEDDSALLVVGDVSGKGLKAAMAVTLIVGALRTLVEISTEPAEILAGLNRRLHGRLTNGFATCLVLHIDSSGDCLIANAGHLSPFLNEREVSLPAALPLGLVLDASYDRTALHLNVDDRLTLYTDGLVEARNATGELFGFERLARLIATRPDASQAVAAAVAFGQDDDITVLTLTRLATGVESTTTLFAPELASPSA